MSDHANAERQLPAYGGIPSNVKTITQHTSVVLANFIRKPALTFLDLYE